LQLSTSIGIGLYPDDADTVDNLMHVADNALYEAKRAGKNRFCAARTLAEKAAAAAPAPSPSPAVQATAA
jgi:predicted signal transduction protein with EAL and GGDEF domain